MKKHTKKNGLRKTRFTETKLKQVILEFLDEREADMAADYKPESEQWKQLLGEALAEYILSNL